MAKAVICELCGSNDLMKQGDIYVCQSCGTKYEPEAARNLMVEVLGGSVVIDKSKELSNLYVLARRAKDNLDSENARKYYEQILIQDPLSWEAAFYSTYFRCTDRSIAETGRAASQLSNCERAVFQLIKENIFDPDERRNAASEVATQSVSLVTGLYDKYYSYYRTISKPFISPRDRNDKEIVERIKTLIAIVDCCRDALNNTGDGIIEIFGDEYSDLAIPCWANAAIQNDTSQRLCMPPTMSFKDMMAHAQLANELNEKITKYKSEDDSQDETETETDSGGCYVATAVYGSYDCPQVWTLRRYRDYTLAESWHGRAFIKTYYAISPMLVRWFGDTNWFKAMWRSPLDRMVARLQKAGVENTPYNDRAW